MPTVTFDKSPSEGRRAIVVSFDLCSFSDFCNHPEAYAVLPKFVSSVFDELDAVWMSALEEFWDGVNAEKARVPAPNFIKYTGDGALMLWLLPEEPRQRQSLCTAVVGAMRKLRFRLAEVIPQWEIEWQTHQLPHRTRFGITTGLVYPLKAKSLTPEFDGAIDYSGYCINLAVRLQDHCPEIGFIVHELVLPKLDGLVKWIAISMKGARSEPVLIFASDFPSMKLEDIKRKFRPTGSETKVRTKARQPADVADDQAALIQPRFEALLVGPEKRRQILFLDDRHPEFVPVEELKDGTGAVIGKRKSVYRLTSDGPPLIYEFVRHEQL